MLNRRHLRIKILHILYALKQGSYGSRNTAEKELMDSLSKFRELYFMLMSLFGDVLHCAEVKIEDGKKKRLPTEEDLNPNLKLVENPVLDMLRNNAEIKAFKQEFLIDVWAENPELIKVLYKILQDSEFYAEYMQNPERSFEEDLQLLVRIFKKDWINNEKLQFFLEEKSILWSDDLDLVASMVIKTLKSLKPTDSEFTPMLPLFRDEKDDRDYLITLFRKTDEHWDEQCEMISKITPNWDQERIAFVDMLLLNMAIAEARFCREVPLKVTMNEFLEISKFYSTPKSKTFLNGVLDKLFANLKKSGEIKKVGRGLLE